MERSVNTVCEHCWKSGIIEDYFGVFDESDRIGSRVVCSQCKQILGRRQTDLSAVYFETGIAGDYSKDDEKIISEKKCSDPYISKCVKCGENKNVYRVSELKNLLIYRIVCSSCGEINRSRFVVLCPNCKSHNVSRIDFQSTYLNEDLNSVNCYGNIWSCGSCLLKWNPIFSEDVPFLYDGVDGKCQILKKIQSQNQSSL